MNNYNIKIVVLIFFLTNCTESSETYTAKKNIEQTNVAGHFSYKGNVPEHITKLDSLTLYPRDPEPTHTIELNPHEVFGKDNEVYLNKIIKAFEDNKGRLVVWGEGLNRKSAVHIYNSDGTYMSQLGRHGKGPGEYGIILSLDVREDKIYVSDFTSLRLNEYSTESYTVKRSIKFEVWNVVDDLELKGHIIPRTDDNYLIAYTKKIPQNGSIELIYLLMDSTGEEQIFEKITVPSGFVINVKDESLLPKPTLPLWFMGTTTITHSDENVLYTVSNREFLIKKFDSNGRFQSAIYYPIEGPTFNLEEYLKSAGSLAPKARQITSAFDRMDLELPKTAPFIEKMIIDDENRIWVALSAGEYYEWWVLNESGELLAKLLLEKKKTVFDIKKGYLYGKRIIDETHEYIVKYKIDFVEKIDINIE